MSAPLLEVSGLAVRFGEHEAVRGVEFAMGRERLGIVGESGSGKSLTGRAILRLLPPGARLHATRLAFAGIDLLAAKASEMRALRGRRLALVLQDPKFSLNPLMPVGEQIAEAYRAHGGASARQAREQTLAMLDAVQIREPRRVHDLYPYEISGGMGQRVMIAMMLAGDPDLLIADEPTSALDVTVQAQVLAVLDEQVSRRDMGLILISHDLDLVARFCDRVLVMERGVIVESLAAAQLDEAQHPYTRRLLAARPRLALP
ncbi:MAG TPA: ABC transporter ATP-binding protein [Stellaceae bacterium]